MGINQGNLNEHFELLSFFNKREIEEIQRRLYRRKYKKGQLVFMEGDFRERIYFLTKGFVKMEMGDLNGVLSYYDYIKPGLMFPMGGLFSEDIYVYTAEAMTDIEVFYVPTVILEPLIKKNQAALLYVIQCLTDNLRAQEQRVQRITMQNATDRVILTIGYLMHNLGEEKDNKIVVNCPFTAMEISRISGTSRETASTVLKQLKEEKVISMVSKKLTIHQPQYFLHTS
ncbi:MAG: Crp/Fnr family transcriptional regulator [Bacillaceae bacterium]